MASRAKNPWIQEYDVRVDENQFSYTEEDCSMDDEDREILLLATQAVKPYEVLYPQ